MAIFIFHPAQLRRDTREVMQGFVAPTERMLLALESEILGLKSLVSTFEPGELRQVIKPLLELQSPYL